MLDSSINEHWLNKTEIDLCVPQNFRLGSSFCRAATSHGGSALYIRDDIEFAQIDIGSFSAEEIFEASAIYLSQENVVVVSLYRTPSSDEQAFIEKLKELLIYFQTSKYKKIQNIYF